jgi:hypothetical protein
MMHKRERQLREIVHNKKGQSGNMGLWTSLLGR